jgi:hypothetical protein
VFQVGGAETATIAGLTIKGGSTGIDNAGALTVAGAMVTTHDLDILNRSGGLLSVTDSTLSENLPIPPGLSCGLLNQGIAAISGSTITGNTSGLYNDGTLMVTDSIIANSQAGEGGGLYNSPDANATIADSTVSGNTSVDQSGLSRTAESI